MKKTFIKSLTLVLGLLFIFPINNLMATNSKAVKPIKQETKVETKKEEPKPKETKKEQVKEQKKEEPQTKQEETKKEVNKETENNTLKFNKQQNAILENVDQNTRQFGSVPNRQFMKIITKEGKLFYLLIEYDDIGEEVKLLTEVSDKDLISLTDGELEKEIKDKIAKETNNKNNVQEKEVNEVITQEDNNQENTFKIKDIILIFVLIVSVGALIYFWKKKKTNEYEEE